MNKFVAAGTLILLSGCADFSSHVSGSFACGAPQGTCEPTMSIDDRALAKIARDGNADAPKGAASADSTPLPASSARTYPVRQAHIVFPGYTDAKGQRHDPVGVYVALNDANFVDTSVTGGGDGSTTPVGFVPSKTNLVTAASAQNDAVDTGNPLPVPHPVPTLAPPPQSAASPQGTAQPFPSSTVQN